MKNTRKCKKDGVKEHFNNWWVVCVYIFIPMAILLFLDKVCLNGMVEYFSGYNVNGVKIINSDDSIENVIFPFIKFVNICIGVILSYVVLHLIENQFIKRDIYCNAVEKVILGVEICIILIAILLAIYSKLDAFEFTQYGYSVDTLTNALNGNNSIVYIPLEEIPAINSVGVKVVGEGILYNLGVKMSQIAYWLVKDLELWVAIIGAIIVPMKQYVAKMTS